MFSTFCESHATEVPFHAVVRLLRAAFGRRRSRRAEQPARGTGAAAPDADPEDMVLLDDLLGIADPKAGAAEDRSGCASAAVESRPRRWPEKPRRSSSLRIRTGSMRSASPCWPGS